MKVQAIHVEKEAKKGRTYSTLVFCPPSYFSRKGGELLEFPSSLATRRFLVVQDRRQDQKMDGWGIALGRKKKQFAWE
jgi:hypothetical protein